MSEPWPMPEPRIDTLIVRLLSDPACSSPPVTHSVVMPDSYPAEQPVTERLPCEEPEFDSLYTSAGFTCPGRGGLRVVGANPSKEVRFWKEELGTVC
jgi:hypothetical protein